MQNYKEMVLGKPKAISIEKIKKDIDSANDWENLYWIGCFLFNNGSGENDKLILDVFEKAFSKGLNITSNREFFLEATKCVAKLYFQFNMYDEAINKLMVLESNSKDLPDWANLYYASAQIHTDSIQYLAVNPEVFFSRIDKIDFKNEESLKKRKLIFLDYLNKIGNLKEEGKLEKIDKDKISKKAQELNLTTTNEFDEFIFSVNESPSLRIEKTQKNSSISRLSLYGYESVATGFNNRIKELQSEIDKQNEIIHDRNNIENRLNKKICELENEIKSLYAGSSKKIKEYADLLEKERTLSQKCEALETQLAGVDNVKNQLVLNANSIADLQTEVEDYKVALSVWKNKCEKLESENEIKKETIDSLQETLQKKEAEIESLKATIRNQELRIEAAEEAVKVAEASGTSTINENVEDGTEAKIFTLMDVLTVDDYLPRNQKILIIGGSETKEDHLRGKLKSMGFSFRKDQLEFQLEYENVKDYASRIKPWSSKYAGIIVGPCPHKAKDIDGYSSFIEQLKSEEGYPPVVEARDKAGNLKISKESVGEAMMKMAIHLRSVA